jgi:hypothetical protein
MTSKTLLSLGTQRRSSVGARRWAAYATTLLLLLPGFAPAVIIDPAGPKHELLQALAEPLDTMEIDVILGKASAFPKSSRPRLAQLQGFVGSERDWSSFATDAWKHAFTEGVAGALIAFKNDPPARELPPKAKEELKRCQGDENRAERETCRFLSDWLKAPPESRVFVAFTRSDRDLALQVQKALEQQHYTVFVYLREGNADPWADPGFVGEVFAMSRHRFVLDTLNSRGSEGVQLEAHCCAWALSPTITTRPEWMEILRSVP